MDRFLDGHGFQWAVTHAEYDPNGNLTKITDPLGRNWTASFDLINRPIAKTDR